ncbi:hypothetical protein PIB30_094878 [Stylosanthes scabra]|uniref:Uncharacterized protein n=1 Tax=Stylosanthes scabra TaxID=79078 RepID=A0ABU6WXC1_9FABA|nr:hypothetical protein [Stylosanthes scabra]
MAIGAPVCKWWLNIVPIIHSFNRWVSASVRRENGKANQNLWAKLHSLKRCIFNSYFFLASLADWRGNGSPVSEALQSWERVVKVSPNEIQNSRRGFQFPQLLPVQTMWNSGLEWLGAPWQKAILFWQPWVYLDSYVSSIPNPPKATIFQEISCLMDTPPSIARI